MLHRRISSGSNADNLSLRNFKWADVNMTSGSIALESIDPYSEYSDEAVSGIRSLSSYPLSIEGDIVSRLFSGTKAI